jgi:hypothetical protein
MALTRARRSPHLRHQSVKAISGSESLSSCQALKTSSRCRYLFHQSLKASERRPRSPIEAPLDRKEEMLLGLFLCCQMPKTLGSSPSWMRDPLKLPPISQQMPKTLGSSPSRMRDPLKLPPISQQMPKSLSAAHPKSVVSFALLPLIRILLWPAQFGNGESGRHLPETESRKVRLAQLEKPNACVNRFVGPFPCRYSC